MSKKPSFDMFQKPESSNKREQESSSRQVPEIEENQDIMDTNILTGRQTSISKTFKFEDIEKSFKVLNGHSNITEWIRNFNEQSDVFQLNDLEKFVFAKKLQRDIAQLYVQYESRAVNFEELLIELKDEFGQKQNSALTHERLKQRKIKRDETPLKYLYEMMSIGAESEIEIEAIITYVIKCLPGSSSDKNYMYEATTLKEFKKKLMSYEIQRQSNTEQHKSYTKMDGQQQQNTKRLHCFNCGEFHTTSQCPNISKGPKCFKCNNFGHRSTDNMCPELNQKPNINIIMNRNRMKKIVQIDGIKIPAQINTGSDINVIQESAYTQYRLPKYQKTEIEFEGIGR